MAFQASYIITVLASNSYGAPNSLHSSIKLIMPADTFDWDKHFTSSSFSQIQNLSPDLSSRRWPSSFSPDRSLYYFSSIDDFYSTSDAEGLQSALKAAGEGFHSLGPDEHQRRYVYYKDFEQACILLLNLVGSDNDYGLPDVVLKNRDYDQANKI